MSRDRQRGFAATLLVPGLLLLVMGLGGTWSQALGQSGGPPPEVVPTVVAGAEGETPPPPRREAVAGESGEAPAEEAPCVAPGSAGTDGAAGGTDGAAGGTDGAAGESGEGSATSPRICAVAGEAGERRVAVAGESGEAPALIGDTGSDDSMRWSLLMAGMMLLAGGSLAFSRARKLR